MRQMSKTVQFTYRVGRLSLQYLSEKPDHQTNYSLVFESARNCWRVEGLGGFYIKKLDIEFSAYNKCLDKYGFEIEVYNS